MKKRSVFAWVTTGIVTVIYLNNASWIAGPPDGELTLLSHRGVHQTYHRQDLTNDACTAERIDTPTHNYLENTIESMRAARGYGANIVELDIHPTTDGEFVVFHDWTVDCRTNGTGKTRDHSLAELQALDIGYGYTADDGQTYPFRGQDAGMMPTLRDVLDTFPSMTFLINIKGRSKSAAQDLLSYLPEDDWHRINFMGHPDALGVLKAAKPGPIYISRQATKSCLKTYLATGWSGYVPKSCHNMYVMVPANLRHLAWGWPHRFENRLNAVGSRSVLIGDLGSHLAGGIDNGRDIDRVPDEYTGIVYTNKIEIIGLVLKPNAQSGE